MRPSRPLAAALQVVINAPALGQDSHGYVGKVLAEPRADFYTPAQLAGWSSLREVRYAGSFEGQTTIAVGVRSRHPAMTSGRGGGGWQSAACRRATDR